MSVTAKTIKRVEFTYPIRKTSANFKNEAFIKIGKGYFSNSRGKRTIASHCSPILPDLRPTVENCSEKLECLPASKYLCQVL